MKQILIVGMGGREHALARAFAKSQTVERVYVAPGNPGMVQAAKGDEASIEQVAVPVTAIEALAEFVEREGIDLTFVGGEQALERGIVDYFQARGLAIVGPTKAAAQLESSKHFAKLVMAQAGVSTAAFRYFAAAEHSEALDYLHKLGLPVVIKADGLMAGKGVVIPETLAEAETALATMMSINNMPVVIEEFMTGPEFSHFALVNGEHIISLGSACDYKRVGDGDLGLNTGGMGAFAPVPWFDADLENEVIEQVVRPVAQQMVADGTPFTGVLYSGLMLTADGPKVIEFNTRLGDPETQVLLPLITTDFMEIVKAHLEQAPLEVDYQTGASSLGVVVAAEGYPGTCINGARIVVPDELADQTYYAGVKKDEVHEQFLTHGGRILMLTALGENLTDARTKVYDALETFSIPNTFYRKDIGLNRQKEDA